MHVQLTSCTQKSSALLYSSVTCFMMSKGKGLICSIVWIAILSSRPRSRLSLIRS